MDFDHCMYLILVFILAVQFAIVFIVYDEAQWMTANYARCFEQGLPSHVIHHVYKRGEKCI